MEIGLNQGDVMSPKEYLSVVEQNQKDKNWEKVNDFIFLTDQGFVDRKDFQGLSTFYDEVVALSLSEKFVQKIKNLDFSNYTKNLSRAINEILGKNLQGMNIKALYVEYFYDTGDASDATLFPCEEFDMEDDSWGSEFDMANILTICPVNSFFDPIEKAHDKQELSFFQYSIANSCINARLLSLTGEVVQQYAGKILPFGFALHDYPIHRIIV